MQQDPLLMSYIPSDWQLRKPFELKKLQWGMALICDEPTG